MNIKRFSVVFMLCSAGFVANAQQVFDGSVTVNDYLSVYGKTILRNEVSIVPNTDEAPTGIMFRKENFVPTISFEGMRETPYEGKFKASAFSFRGGPARFDSVYVNGGVCFVPDGSIPLSMRIISGENGVPTILCEGGYDPFLSSGRVKASEFFFESKLGVGVNKINEGVAMQVAGKILCTGDIEVASIDASDIKTNDITVKMNDVADYVFEEGYDLKNLSEVEAYVNANKHLPGIPSAAEIEKDGVSLSKMTNLLLEKVEELTLHMIQLEKENKALKAEMQSLKK